MAQRVAAAPHSQHPWPLLGRCELQPVSTVEKYDRNCQLNTVVSVEDVHICYTTAAHSKAIFGTIVITGCH
jgi:hypothetical protein